jgi:hypothetical protein
MLLNIRVQYKWAQGSPRLSCQRKWDPTYAGTVKPCGILLRTVCAPFVIFSDGHCIVKGKNPILHDAQNSRFVSECTCHYQNLASLISCLTTTLMPTMPSTHIPDEN